MKRVPKRLQSYGAAPKVPSGRAFDEFWALIDRARGNGWRAGERAFRRELSKLDDKALLEMHRCLQRLLDVARDNVLLSATSLLRGDMSDDAFLHCEGGVVSFGRPAYEAALMDPDTLADIDKVDNRIAYEGFQNIPGDILRDRGLEVATKSGRAKRPKYSRRRIPEAEWPRLFPRLAVIAGR